MKRILIIVLSLLAGEAMMSQKMMTRAGSIKFDASMPDLVEIAATNTGASCIFDKATGDFVALALVKSFKFKSSKLNGTKTSYDLEGDLTIHGVTKKIKTKIALVENGGKVTATSNFTVKCKDYAIEIPSLVKEKFAENIKVGLDFDLEGK